MDEEHTGYLFDLAPGVPLPEHQPLIEAALAAKGIPPPLRIILQGHPENEVAALRFADQATLEKFRSVRYFIVDGRVATPVVDGVFPQRGDLHRVFIGNIPFTATNNEIAEAAVELIAPLSISARDVQGVRVALDRETGRSRGFAFLTTYSATAAEAVRDVLNHAAFDGRVLRCDIAVTRQAPPAPSQPPTQHGVATPSAADLTSRFGHLNLSTPVALNVSRPVATPPQRVARAFTMELYPGKESEYKKRHDEIWPELSAVLKEATISNYNIFLHGTTLFAFYECTDEAAVSALKDKDVVQRWWAFMAPLMKCHPDNSPITTPLASMFRLP